MKAHEAGGCTWPGGDALMQQYHDTEWGVPLHDDRKLFEFMVLDAFQAGLSWRTILHKRDAFHKAFASFEPAAVALFSDAVVEGLMQDTGIIRNRQKIKAAIVNAQLFLDLQREQGSFDNYIWQFTGGRTIMNNFSSMQEVPARSIESDAMSKDLKKLGFKFVGSTICYAFMQAAGIVNDHLTTCPRHAQVGTANMR